MLLELLVLLNKEYVYEANLDVFMTAECEQCGLTYHYLMHRHVKTSAVAWGHIGKAKAERRAIEKGQEQFRKMSSREAELVPCPQCHWISQSLVDGYLRGRRMEQNTKLILGVGGFVVGVLVAAGLVNHFSSLAPGSGRVMLLVACGVIIVMGVLLPAFVHLVLQRLRRGRNYNRLWPDPPRGLPMGTPRPMLPGEDDQGREIFEEVSTADPQTLDDTSHAVFRLGHFQWPTVCCQCLEPTEKLFYIKREADKLALPFCPACRRKRSMGMFLHLGVVTLVAFVIITIALMLIPATYANSDLRWMLVFWTVLSWLIYGLAYLVMAKKPFKWKWINQGEGRFWVKARNRQYNQLLQEHAISTPFVISFDDEDESLP